ncbi:MAG: amidohydrolase family protein [Candidatus Bathyarchaeota archaeon]|nr:amidohydrolase family protein [Candidatus Bathyarchaeota archaeon]
MYDLVIRNGRVIDGAGNPWIRANVAVEGDRIAKVSRREMDAELALDAGGLVVSPGFIDSHTHSDSTVLENNIGMNFLTQGVTTVVTGECGGSMYPFDEGAQRSVEAQLRTRSLDPSKVAVDWLSLEDWRRKLEGMGIGVNHIPLVGHRTIRTRALGNERARGLKMPEPGEIEAEKEILRGAMEDGAFGLSISLSANNVYPEECVEVLKVVKEHGGVFHNHMRSLFYTLRDAVRETIMIAERSGVPGVCSHVYGRKYEGWGKPVEAMRQIQEARDRGVEVVADVYPWPFAACANALSLFVGGGAYDERVHGRLEEGLTVEGMVRDLEESTSWMGMKEELTASWEAENEENERRRRLLWERSRVEAPRTRPVETTPVIAHSKTHHELVGLNFTEVAEALGMDDWLAALRRVIIDDGGATYLGTTMTNEEDRKAVMSRPWTMFESDSSMVDRCPPQPMIKPVHPRGSACAAMILGRHVREQGLMTLEEAVRKMTSLTAQFHGMGDRGLIREGMKADIAVFDPKTVTSNATYAEPCRWATGISTVIVNGRVEYDEGRHTGQLAGKVLRLKG